MDAHYAVRKCGAVGEQGHDVAVGCLHNVSVWRYRVMSVSSIVV